MSDEQDAGKFDLGIALFEPEADPEPEETTSSVGAPKAPVLVDLDPDEWLSIDESKKTDWVVVGAGRIKIAALTEGEVDGINKATRTKDRKIDLQKSRLLTIAYSINKAAGRVNEAGQFVNSPDGRPAIQPNSLRAKLGGEMTVVYRAINRLSGFVDEKTSAADMQDFFV